MPSFQAAATVARASASGMSRNILPSGAVPKPSRPGRRSLRAMGDSLRYGMRIGRSGGVRLRELGITLRPAAEVGGHGRVEQRGVALQALDQVRVADEVPAEGDHVGLARGRRSQR
eukprot:Opistho-1_new@106592